VLIAEKRLNRAMFGASADDNEAYCTAGWSGNWGVYRWGATQPAPDSDAPGDTRPQDMFGSAHANGFNSVFCDGSVRFISYSVNLGTWTRACVRNDNQIADPDNL
jgi:prepilin-type processing-associated H-X9-DG protein